jgi:hypothetical protein
LDRARRLVAYWGRMLLGARRRKQEDWCYREDVNGLIGFIYWFSCGDSSLRVWWSCLLG